LDDLYQTFFFAEQLSPNDLLLVLSCNLNGLQVLVANVVFFFSAVRNHTLVRLDTLVVAMVASNVEQICLGRVKFFLPVQIAMQVARTVMGS
jgi:hypothetical protein